MPSASARLGRWLKPAGTIVLYVLVFYWTDARAILGRLRTVELTPLVAGIAIYAAGQALSTFKWRMLLGPAGLVVSYARLLGFYFTGMFFNLFLPTIVGGDAVKAVLLARETRAPARATMSVFMERNTGLCALLMIAVGASLLAPPVRLFGVPLAVLAGVIAAAYVAANAILLSPWAYHLADRLIAATPLARMRPRAQSLYDAITPYKSAVPTLVAALALSLAFQAFVIAVVFLNARALSLAVPLSAVAVFVPLVSLAGMVPVSVNGLGVREALYILLFGQVGVSPELAVSLALVYLAVTVVASLPGGLVYALQPTSMRLSASGEAAPNLP
jgi:glycosyltransferase 2 family protein